jgi:xanthine dehydrogenase molybdenum-binding subunit
MAKIIKSYYEEQTSQKDMSYQLDIQPPENAQYIGKRGMRRKDGYDKVSGFGLYSRDIKLPGMLYAKQLMSPYAHATIKSMDTSKAEAFPGVRAVFRYDDPDNKGTLPGASPVGVVSASYPVAVVVVADSVEIVDNALKLVEIEWEQLPVEVDWDVAMQDKVILQPD